MQCDHTRLPETHPLHCTDKADLCLVVLRNNRNRPLINFMCNKCATALKADYDPKHYSITERMVIGDCNYLP